MVAMGTNALASSIVLVCRQRAADAPTATRRKFVNALKAELPVALVHLQRGNIAPVDLAQAAIGPGMAVYTRYARVLDAAGTSCQYTSAGACHNNRDSGRCRAIKVHIAAMKPLDSSTSLAGA